MAKKKRAMLGPAHPPISGTDATLVLSLSTMRNFTRVGLEVHAAVLEDEGKTKTDQTIGTLKGIAMPVPGGTSLVPDVDGVTGDVPQPDPGDPNRKRVVALTIPGGGSRSQVFFPIPDMTEDEKKDLACKTRHWVIYVKMTEPDATESNRVAVGILPFGLTVGAQATYDWHAGNKVDLYVHGGVKAPAGSGHSAFEDMVAAIGQAKKFIFISDWSFHTYFRVKRDGSPLNAQTIGRLLLEAAKRDVLVGILAWKHPTMFASKGAPVDEQNNNAPQRFMALNGNNPLPKNLLWRGTTRTTFCSHHQKFVVLDCDAGGRRMIKAFFGGLDLTKGRWDWHEHIIDPAAKGAEEYKRDHFVPLPGGQSQYYDDWYSSEFQSDTPRTIPGAQVVEGETHEAGSDMTRPREPWHDIYGAVTGPSAWDFVREWIGRWSYWGGGDIGDLPADPDTGFPTDGTKRVYDLYDALHKDKSFIQQHEPSPAGDDEYPWATQVVRSMEKGYWQAWPTSVLEGYKSDFNWILDASYERSIQDAYLNAIGMAEEYVYIETQYFISSGAWGDTSSKNQLAAALCARIEKKKARKEPFHVYIVTPMYPEGSPDSDSIRTQRCYEWRTMQYMIGRLGPQWKQSLSFFFPAHNGVPKGGPHGYPPPGQLARVTDLMFVGSDGKVASLGDPNQDHLIAPGTKMLPISRRKRMQINNRYMVYVHSKLMLVDDTYAIFGSANLNERSLAGDRDSEICVQMWPKYPAQVDVCKKKLKKFRDDLFQEHFGATGDPKTFGPKAQATADQNFKNYALGTVIDPGATGLCLALPLDLVGGSLVLKPIPGVAEWSSDYLFDADTDKELWKWWSDKTSDMLGLAE
jgi:phospholipase D1/2